MLFTSDVSDYLNESLEVTRVPTQADKCICTGVGILVCVCVYTRV